MMPSYIAEILRTKGFTDAQISSAGVSKLIEILLNESGIDLLTKGVNELSMRIAKETAHFDIMSKEISELKDAQQDFGQFTDEKARNAVLLYKSLIGINEANRIDNNEFIKDVSYILFAYFGGSNSDLKK